MEISKTEISKIKMSVTNIVELGQWTSDFSSFEQNLFGSTAPEEIYFVGGHSASQKHTPSSLMSVIKEFISCWRDADKYELSKVTLHNFHHLPDGESVTKQTYPGVWRHFSHSGCVIIFNPNDVDFTIQLYDDPEQYQLDAGEMIFIKTNAKFCYQMKQKSTKLKHMVVYSFWERV